MEAEDISVIVPAYNVESTLESTLEGLLRQEYPAEVDITIIDSGSSDGTAEIAESYSEEHDDVSVTSKDLDGFAAAINEGIRQASNELLCTINPDCEPESDRWLEKLVDSLDPGEDVVGAQPYTEIPEELVENSSIFYRLFYGGRDPNRPQETELTTYNFQPNGYVFLKTPVEDVGLLDEETYRVAGEDFDLSVRMQREGYMSAVVPVKLLHHHGKDQRFGLRDYLAKQLQYSGGQGAITRRYPFDRHYTYWNEFTKSGLYFSLLLPKINLVTFPALIIYLALYIWKNSGNLELLEFFKAPLIKAAGDIYNIIGFYRGLLTGRQSTISHRFWEF